MIVSKVCLRQYKLARHIEKRLCLQKDLLKIKKKRSKSTFCYCFWCSSAGEYEQARPLIQRLTFHNTYILIIFFSKSGYDYALSRNEKHSYYLFSHDSIFFWERFFKAARPRQTFVVRHELWPAFLHCANKYSNLILINASTSNILNKSYFNIKSKQFLLLLFHNIFVISKKDYSNFQRYYKINRKKLTISNDTKYESAYLRTSNKNVRSVKIRKKLTCFGKKNSRLIVGSAWEKDIKLVLDTVTIVKKIKKVQVVLVPHKITTHLINNTLNYCKQRKLSYTTFDPNIKCQPKSSSKYDVILVTTMGTLAELYHCASFAYVGGAMHYQVHNVLEPLAYGLPIAFGPYYKNSPEAVALIANHIAQVIATPEKLATWWLKTAQTNDKSKIHTYFKKQLGASNCILKQLLSQHY